MFLYHLSPRKRVVYHFAARCSASSVVLANDTGIGIFVLSECGVT